MTELVPPAAALWTALTVVLGLAGSVLVSRLFWPDTVTIALVAFAAGIAWDAYGTRLADWLIGRVR